MAKLYKIEISTARRVENVAAETQEEAVAKLKLADGELVLKADEIGEVTV